jgi:hypothetical protein
MKYLLSLLLVTVLLTACGPVAPTPAPAPAITPTTVPNVLSVDPAIDLGPISPYLFGTNYGPMHAVTLEVMPLAEGAGFTVLRFPGGAWTDEVDVRTFQIDQFIAFCQQVGATPTISVRLLNGEPETAAELVRYTNIEKQYGVVYWSIGNEPSIYTQLNQADYDYTVEHLNRDWRPIAEAMKAVDSSIKLMGPEIHQWNDSYETTPKDSAGRDWMTEFLKVNGDLLDVVTVHRYPMYSGNAPVTTVDLRNNIDKWVGELQYLRSLTREILGRELPIAITELNSDPSQVMMQQVSPDSFYNAIWYANVLGELMNADVFMVNQWVISQRSTGLGLFSGNTIRPTYYVFPLYKNFGSQQVYAASGVPDVSIYAARNAEGALTLMVINMADNERQAPLQIADVTPTSARVWLLDSERNAADLGIQPLPVDGILNIPAWSATLFVIEE